MKQEKQTPLERLICETMSKQQKILFEREIEIALALEKDEKAEDYMQGWNDAEKHIKSQNK